MKHLSLWGKIKKMPTIAELQINLDARPITEGTKALNDFANAADRASKAGKENQQVNNTSSSAADKAAKSESDLSAQIDLQTKKLQALGEQRKKLESSGMKSTAPAEYEKLNRIIDANIALVNKQGNAIDMLNAKQDRDSTKRESALAAEVRAQERLNSATIRQENAITAAAARQQRQIENTINGLDRQIKAQNDYNRTIDTLNKARAESGMGGPGDNRTQMSSSQYEQYVKLAQAQRDAAFATEDNSRALLAAERRLETHVASLGKAERASVQYARAERDLNESLKLGKVTQDEYDQKLAAFASKRDKAVAAANDNSAAEAKFEKSLKAVMGAYDPVIRAQEQYNVSSKILTEGLANGTITLDQYTKAMGEQKQALEGVKSAQTGTRDVGEDYQKALNELIPYRAELKNLELQEKILQQQKASGKVTTQQQIDDYNKATATIERNRKEINKRIESSTAASLSYKQEAAAMRGIPAQFTDIVVSLQGGQAPLTVLLQQGGQLKDMFGGVGPAMKAMGTYLLGLVNPATVAAAAFGTLGIAAYQGSQEMVAFNRALVQSANSSGTSASQFAAYRDSIAETGKSAGQAAEALTLMTQGGRIASDMFTQVGEAALNMAKATGTPLKDIVDDFTAIGKEPVEAAVRLDEKYRFLTSAVLANAQALVEQGKEQQAAKLLQGELAEAANKAATEMINKAGTIEKAWNSVTRSIRNTWDTLKGIGRESGVNQVALKAQQDLMARTVERLKEGNLLSSGMSDDDIKNNPAVKQIQSQIDKYQELVDVENKEAAAQGEAENKRREAAEAQDASYKRHISSLEGVEKAEYNLQQVRIENAKINAGGNVNDKQREIMASNEAEALKKLKEAKEKDAKVKPTAIDNRQVQEVKSNLAIINAEYESYYKKVTSLGAAHIVSEEATYRSQKAILEAQREAVSKSYASQISEIEKLSNNKKNSAAQNISLSNQMTKVEADRVVALEKIDSKLDALNIKEKGRLEERTRNIASYKAALDSQLEGLQEEGQRAADGVGRGSRQAGVDRRLGEIDRSFEKQQLGLSKALSSGSMDPTEYAEKLQLLKDNHTAMTEQVIKNDKDIQRANSDWTNGFQAAVDNALDAGMNFAGTMEGMLTGAFNRSGDALAKFVTTGKMNFKDFAYSVMADMAAMAAKQAAMGALGALFKFGMTAASAYFGGGPASAGSTQAGYIGTDFSSYQAQGGAWTGGTQMFANGGAFSNSVVSTPTAFGMSGNRRGIMGEAGPEAIVPLARTSNGDLGIRAMGGFGDSGGKGGTIVNVQVNVDSGGASASSDGGDRFNQFGNELGAFVNQRIYTIINSETKPGGSLQSQG